jgi:hypothetical protein
MLYTISPKKKKRSDSFKTPDDQKNTEGMQKAAMNATFTFFGLSRQND